jgi:annexin A7/11
MAAGYVWPAAFPTGYVQPVFQPMTQAYDSKIDGDTLHNAFKGVGTDEKAVISVLGHRTKAQLLQLAADYPKSHKHTLEHNLQSELSGNFRDLAIGLIKHPTVVKIDLIKKATKGAGTRENALIDVLVGSSGAEITAMNQTDPSVIASVLNDVSGELKKVLSELMKGIREPSGTPVNDNEARQAADTLYHAGEGKIGTDEKVFVEIIARRSPEFLARVSDHYQAKHKHTLEHAVKSETSGYFESCLVGLLKPKYVFIADRLYKAMHGAGTDDVCLVYFFSILEKNELQEVARIFEVRHKKSLADFIKGDTSGNYKDLLLARLQPN